MRFIQTNSKFQSLQACPCAGQCPPCNGGPQTSQNECGCAPPCAPCSAIAKSIKYIHESAANEAQQDAVSQLNLMKQSELQAKLFALAQKYAEEANASEQQAKKAAIELQECSSRAQIARNKMHRAVQQAKQLALRTSQEPASIPRAVSINVNHMPTIVYNVQSPTNAAPFMDLPGANEGIDIMTEIGMNNEYQEPQQQIQQNQQLSGRMFFTQAENIDDAPENIEEAMMNNEIELSQDLENKAENELIQFTPI